jgi:predicted RecB family nuclease
VRIPGADSVVQRSFWADECADEEKIWMDFLQLITNIENPQLIYYSSYETVFLRRLKKRYGGAKLKSQKEQYRLLKRILKSGMLKALPVQ